MVSIRELSDGRVLVNDANAKRVVIFDSLLAGFRVTYTDSSAGTSIFGRALKATSLIRYLGDSTLFCDLATGSLLVFDGDGGVARVVALPHPDDLTFLAFDVLYGPPMVDPRGRVTYRGAIPGHPLGKSIAERLSTPTVRRTDSAVIVRVDLDERTTDTLASVKNQQAITVSMVSAGRQSTVFSEVDPLASGDQWTMLSDGTIAVVRGHDYHIDWIGADGSTRSTPKMPMDWRRVSPERKQALFDSITDAYKQRNEQQRRNEQQQRQRSATGTSLLSVYRSVPIDKMADYEPALGPSAVLAAPENAVWVLPRTTLSARDGLLYDVIGRDGAISYRVQLPAATKVVGFGANGAIYLLRVVGKQGYLQRVTLAE